MHGKPSSFLLLSVQITPVTFLSRFCKMSFIAVMHVVPVPEEIKGDGVLDRGEIG